jgi:hypothetical protein
MKHVIQPGNIDDPLPSGTSHWLRDEWVLGSGYCRGCFWRTALRLLRSRLLLPTVSLPVLLPALCFQLVSGTILARAIRLLRAPLWSTCVSSRLGLGFWSSLARAPSRRLRDHQEKTASVCHMRWSASAVRRLWDSARASVIVSAFGRWEVGEADSCTMSTPRMIGWRRQR